MIISALLMACGTAIRCISMNETVFTWMAHTGANLNGVAGIVLCAVPPALSSLWFVFYYVGNAHFKLMGESSIRSGFHPMKEPQRQV